MGNWKLEVAKMGLYITFPVALFHYFNQTDLFEDWVIQKKRELYPPQDTPLHHEFVASLQQLKDQQNAERIRQLERKL